MLVGRLSHTTVDFLGEFGTVELSHTFKHRFQNDTFRVITDIFRG